KAMTKYFDDDRDKEILVQWRGRFENKIKEFHEDQVRGVKRKLDEVIEQKNACKKLDDKKPEFENKLLQKSKELAHQFRDEKDEEKLQQFNSVWSGWVSELTAGTKPIKDINYEGDLITILQELGFEWALIAERESSGKYKKISEVGDYIDYVSLTKERDLCNTGHQFHENERKIDRRGQEKHSGPANRIFEFVSEKATKVEYYFKGYFQYEEQKQIRMLIDNIEEQSLDALKSKPVATRGYSP
ncbi:interferon-induced very large GTPase 1-like, partial [Plectropomus leopardus]|uniref:interferon-induced very large GTPase 1-like n=1 Tax=Plectropomus leopardus TaxID=160734 RepID=UPI001C4AF4D4